MYRPIKDIARQIGLSVWALRTGCLSGRYPFIRAGGSRGTILIDPDELSDVLKRESQANIMRIIEPVSTSESTTCVPNTLQRIK